MLSVCALAQWKGEKPERLGAAFALICGVAGIVIHIQASDDLKPLLLLGADAILAGGFLFLAVRYASLWLGAAMILQSAQFMLHAIYTASELPHDLRYAVINNSVTFGIFLVILLATLASWRRRTHEAQEVATEG